MSSVIGALRFDLGLNTAAFDTGMDKANGKAKGFASGIVKALAPVTAALAAAFSVKAIAESVDAWSDLNSRLRNATGSAEAGASAMDRLQNVARRSYSSITQTTEAFLRQSTTLTALGVSTAKQLDLTEALNNALVISATRGQRAESVMDAWGKGMALGALRGDSLNTVIAGSDRLAKALADSMGINVAELQRYGAEGKITREVMLGITDQLEQLRTEAEEMPATLSDGLGIMRDALFQLVGRIDQAVGSSETFAGMLVEIGDAVTRMTPYFVGLARVIADNLVKNFDALINIGKAWIALGLAGVAVRAGSAFLAFAKAVRAAGIASALMSAASRINVMTLGVWAAVLAQATGNLDPFISAVESATVALYNALPDSFRVGIETAISDFGNLGLTFAGVEDALNGVNLGVDDLALGLGAAGSAAGGLEQALEAMRAALATEEEAERASFEKRIAQIQEFYDRGMIAKAEYDQLMERAHEAHAERMTEITAKQVEEENRIRSQMVGHASSIFGSLSTIFANFGEENLALSKAFAVAQAIVNTAEGITKALAQGGMLGFAGAAAVAASGAAQISTILSANKGTARRPTVGASAATGQGSAPQPVQQQAVKINLQGDYHPTSSVEQLIDELLKMQRDGYQLILERD